jgi:peroxiredoxin
MRSLLVFAMLVLIGACRPEPVPHNPITTPTGPTLDQPAAMPEHSDDHAVDRDTTQSVAPAGSTVTKTDGTPLDLATLWDKHRALVVFYMGGWCPHCKRQLETLEQYQADIGKADAVIVGVSADKPEDAKTLHDNLHLDFELVSDTDLAVISKWGVEDVSQHIAYPAVFVVEKGGAISYRKVGANPTDRPSIDEIMGALNAKK